MKLQVGLAVTAVCAGMLNVASAADFEDTARVINVTPQVEQVNQPRQECRTEYVTTQRQQQRGVGGSIVGGVAGGILGNQVGGGNGRTVATAVGAATGAMVGDRMSNGGPSYQTVQRCRTVMDQVQVPVVREQAPVVIVRQPVPVVEERVYYIEGEKHRHHHEHWDRGWHGRGHYHDDD